MTGGESGRRRATLVGFGAVLLWATLALFTALSGTVPPLQLLAMCFGVGGTLGLLWGGVPRGVPPGAWALGVGGLFGYHLLYVLALRAAPPVEASLVAYLWPLLIVLLSALFQRLRWFHVAGAALGLLGAALVVSGGRGMAFAPLPGHAIALAAAFVWTGYSVLQRRYAEVPTAAVSGFCLGAALLAGAAHLLLEETVVPQGTEWLAILGLGLGPVGAAFFLWDVGCKRGDLAVLGASSYAAPLLSTLVLVVFGLAEPTWTLALACALITGGAALAASEMLLRRS
ncbi:DMT family transporter [Jannaschia sp. W003]|uniref:aromatic amino acid exporter YddG n=1 Tax=Jannaschia sp. W003 TaxID=2867012 RepID=UPI0021A9094A|nr:EamA family transporter [Jannaschia sp. W003]UWQ21931.1 EamA family transporter [Jannaschia sp. W003]